MSRSSWLLPGFRSHQPARMLMATCGHLLMLFSSFNMEAKGDSVVDRFLLRLSFFMILFMIVLFACNYRNIKGMCLFRQFTDDDGFVFWDADQLVYARLKGTGHGNTGTYIYIGNLRDKDVNVFYWDIDDGPSPKECRINLVDID